MRQPALVLALVVLSLLAGGCGPFDPDPGKATPEEAAIDLYTRSAVEGRAILGSRTLGSRAIVLFARGEDDDEPAKDFPDQQVEAVYVMQERSGWKPQGSYPQLMHVTVQPPFLVCAGLLVFVEDSGSSTIVLGRVRLPEVASVEVQFDSGLVLTDTTNEAMFAVLAPSVDAPDTLRLLDPSGQVIHSERVGTPNRTELLALVEAGRKPGVRSQTEDHLGCSPVR